MADAIESTLQIDIDHAIKCLFKAHAAAHTNREQVDRFGDKKTNAVLTTFGQFR